jgi:hypothetical protein
MAPLARLRQAAHCRILGGAQRACGEYSSPSPRFFKRTIRLTKRTIPIKLRVFPEQSGSRGDLSSSLRRVTKR